MKRLISIVLTVLLLGAMTSCDTSVKSEPIDQSKVSNVLFIGDDLMETSKVNEYFDKLCQNSGKSISVDCVTQEDARMYTFADMCDNDADFADKVKNADIIVFEEGTSENTTTYDSVSHIYSYCDDARLVCLSYYGYPSWMYKKLFDNTDIDVRHADANYFISHLIASDNAPIGYEHLCRTDYIHPNELNGYISSVIVYCEIFSTMPCYVPYECFKDDTVLADQAKAKAGDPLNSVLGRISEIITAEMVGG